MRLMIASDIHGSALYCGQMLEAYEREGADRLLILGDILYHGPRNDLPEGYAPKEVISMLNPLKSHLLCVRGNCDTEVDQMVLEFPMMADYCLLELPADPETATVFATHGHVYSPNHLPPLKNGDILLTGHTHIPACDDIMDMDGNRYQYLNPGSVSIPKEGSEHSYMIYESGRFQWKNMQGKEYMTWKTDSRF
ncbi:MAG TPA: phosphodiesterase [Candidatus Mediterraneibacter pullistercoris]|nr:phosphodiesterase [Candidatus Mediterraneibacter pullistercoris]